MNIEKIVFLFFALTLLQTSSSSAVVGGHDLTRPRSQEERTVRDHTIRFVSFENGEFKGFCSGFMMSTNEVLSAAHCFESEKHKELLENGHLFVEKEDPDHPGVFRRFQIKDVLLKNDDTRDLAYVTLMKDLPLKESVPLAIASCDEGSSFLSVGYGISDDNKPSASLKMASYRKLTEDEHTRVGPLTFNQPENDLPEWVVLKKEKGSVCLGDSGGPIFCRSKGRLALAAVNKNISANDRSMKYGDYKMADYCRNSANYLVGSRISPNVHLIQSWQSFSKSERTAVPKKPGRR